MRICFMIHSLNSGGAERVLSQLASYFADIDEHDVHVVTLQPEGSRPFYPISPNITLHNLGLNKTGSELDKIQRIFKLLLSIRKTVKHIRPRKIISFIDEMNIAVLLATLGLKQHVIISERIDPRYHKIGFLSKALRRLLYPLSKSLVVQASYIASYFSYMRNKCLVIANPIPAPKFLCSDLKTTTKIINVGRLNTQKNQAILIKAFSSLALKYPDWSLEIYGEGPERDKLKALIKKLSLEDKVFLQGITASIQEKLSQASIFAFPSLFEGFPNALGEAIASGLSVIASNCEGNLELVHHSENGLTFPVGDQNQLTTRLEELMNKPIKRVVFGKKAQQSVKQFSPENIYKQWELVIH